MNACPYDAIYINPETNTAHKCNFCNHRIDQGLEPSCVIVCPTQAIKVGDLDDPASEVSRIVARDDVAVRAPEQNTKPKVFYRGADQASLDPTRTTIAADGLIWSETTAAHPRLPDGYDDAAVVARTAYATGAHPLTWAAKVSGYLVTKAIAAGTMLVAALLVLLGHADVQATVGVVPPLIAGTFLAVTGVLLVADLKQPARFHYLLTRGNPTSWLVKGAWILMAYAVATGIWWIGGLAGSGSLVEIMAAPTAVLAAATAGYTAYLFAQCEGRDLWQSPLLLPMLLAQAAAAGGAVYTLVDVVADVPESEAAVWVLLGGVLASLALVLVEVTAHGTRQVELAVHDMVAGAQKGRFRIGIVVGMLVPAALAVVALAADTSTLVPALAGLCALVGMWFYEDAYVRAGQSVPLS
ncbi:MAG: 4Fe-4S ferredoxin [Actinomyces sp.]|nr:MAG: 4Fe-4S ferredoxin [Actinomyces sp.]